MCQICRQYPCHPRCPNAPEPKTVHVCAHCGEPIVEGDEYAEYFFKYYHDSCLGDAAPAILVDDGAVFHEATDTEVKLGVCAHCEEEVLSNEDSYEYNGKWYHAECFEDCASILLEDDITMHTASAENDGPEYDPADKLDI